MINTLINFDEAPNKLTEYKLPDTLTRENFISFLILSYAVSRGHPPIQTMFFKWVAVLTGFPVKDTIANFVQAGGYDALSEEEKRVFQQAFVNVKKHSEEFMEFEFEDEWQSDMSVLVEERGNENAAPFFDFEKIQYLSDFREASAKYLARNSA